VSIYIKLKEVRESRGMSQEHLARAVGVGLSAIQKWEYQKVKSASFETLEKLCLVLECSPGDLLIVKCTPLKKSS
jgi:putative transcriptional regulator